MRYATEKQISYIHSLETGAGIHNVEAARNETGIYGDPYDLTTRQASAYIDALKTVRTQPDTFDNELTDADLASCYAALDC